MKSSPGHSVLIRKLKGTSKTMRDGLVKYTHMF